MLATALALCALGLAPPSADVAAVLAVLDRGARVEGARESLAAGLVRLGPASIPDLFSVLALGTGLERPLDTLEEDALTDALGTYGAATLRPCLRQRLTGDPAVEERIAALRVLGRAGSSADLDLVRLALRGAGTALADGLQETCTAILARDPRALEPLRRWMLEAPVELGSALARAVGASACPQALEALARSLGFRADLDAELLAAIAPLAARAPKPVDERVLRPMEDALQSDEPVVLRAAILALGHAQHGEVVLPLTALLEHESRGVSTAAEWALGNITGLRFHADVQRWRGWVRAERAWLEGNGGRLRAELRARAAEVVIRALGELSSHRLRRHELAQEALFALEHESPVVRRLACTALAQLGSSAAQPGLVQALEDEDESVVRSARQALEVLGLTVPDQVSGGATAILDEPSRKATSRSTNPPRDA